MDKLSQDLSSHEGLVGMSKKPDSECLLRSTVGVWLVCVKYELLERMEESEGDGVSEVVDGGLGRVGENSGWLKFHCL